MMFTYLQGPSIVFRVVAIAGLWLCLISILHATLNREHPVPQRLRMGYMPVITNLAAPILDHVSKGTEVYFEAVKFGSFAEMAEAFRSKHIQVAFIIAPLAIALHQQKVPLKVVYIGNRHESTLVVRRDLAAKEFVDLVGKTVAVPIRYSGHLLALKRCLRQRGFDEEAVRIVEIPPPDMPAALSTGSVDGYFVGEPFAGKSLKCGAGVRLLDVEMIWPKFICNLMIVQEQLVRDRPQWVQRLVTAAARSGLWARNHVDETVELATPYWGQDPEVVRYAFSHPPGRIRFDLYVPLQEELEELGREMRRAGLVQGQLDLSDMVDDRFALNVESVEINSVKDILPRL